MEFSGIGTILWGGAEAALAILLALGLLRLASILYGMLAPHDAEAVPLLHVLALAAGLASGVALLLAVPHGDDFRLSRIFVAEGPWTLDLPGFLARHGLPSRATLDHAAEQLRQGGLGAMPGGLALLLLASGPLAALRWWRGKARLRALAAFLLFAASTALLLHYAIHLLAWMLALLNFWLFAVLLVLFQRWRYAPRGHH
ncbi:MULTISPECIES: hypothetical protein [Roseomonadaceae]|uniref:Uncharacterized protein n=1 Tax=Falsiroseomonas oleicola TaxID=2801474 RepID=A0ABS6H455_9PROT|nr:hypothetical protein [Roseomonas oleicola]MBU8543171.1 hypothetical protein [Roseomonas oleicola]